VPGGLWITVTPGLVRATVAGVDQRRITAFIRAQRGLFTRVQARSSGFSEYQVRRRLTSGEWKVVLGRVLTIGTTPVTPELRDRAAALLVPHAVLTGASAARVYGIHVPDRRTFLWVGDARRRPLGGVIYLHDPLSPREITLGEGLRLVRPGRAVFDCLRFLEDRHALDLLDRALHARWITHGELAVRVRAHYGRPGVTRLLRLLRVAGTGARSAAERLTLALLRRHGITGWRANEPIADAGRVIAIGDVVFRDRRLVIEIDGWAYHSTPDRYQDDRTRQNLIVRAGWDVLRFTWRDLVERPDEVVGTIRDTLARRRPRGGRDRLGVIASA
jgi:very-short-patch-repair endonuclease